MQVELTSQHRSERRPIPRDIRVSVYARDGHRCRNPFCPVPHVDQVLSIDHRVPLGLGGRDEQGNYQTLCVRCNGRKGMRTWEQFLLHEHERAQHVRRAERRRLRRLLDALRADPVLLLPAAAD